MDIFESKFLFFVFILFTSFSLTRNARKWFMIRKTRKLIKELEAFFDKDLPFYKNNRDPKKVNWEKVLKWLREQPTTQQVAHWKEMVKGQIKQYGPHAPNASKRKS